MSQIPATIKLLASELAAKKVSSQELAKHYLQRIQSQLGLNAVISVDEEATMAQARQADERLAQGQASVLTGIPLVHKDVFVTKVWKTTAGSKILDGYVSPFDAHVVEHLGPQKRSEEHTSESSHTDISRMPSSA